MPAARSTISLALFVLLLAVGGWLWWAQRAPGLPPGIVASNGRIEAVEIDVATKTPGRLADIAVNEGDFVAAGQVLGRMDTAVLEAQLREAEAMLERAHIGITAAQSQVTQREAEKRAALALVAQRRAELAAAEKRVKRSEGLAPRGAVSTAKLDDDVAGFEAARAALNAAEAQVAAADAVIARARSEVIAARATKPAHVRPSNASTPRSPTACCSRRATAACSSASRSRAKCSARAAWS